MSSYPITNVRSAIYVGLRFLSGRLKEKRMNEVETR